jgi:tripartite ATP-independent transporter DctM subunit
VIAAGGTLGILIPPSVPLVIYAIITEQNIAKLFLAAFVPGIIAAIGYMVVIGIIARVSPKDAPRGDRFSWAQRLTALAETWPVLLIFLVVIGGIYGGFFTPTEAAAVAVFYALFVGMVVYGEIKPRNLFQILKKSAVSSAVIMFIIANAGLFAFLLTRAGVPGEIGRWLSLVLDSPILFLLGVNIALFVIGMFIETSAAILVLAPILVPVAIHFGVDPVHFGLIMVINLAMGMITPPFGVNLFAACTIARISLDQIIGRLIPFIVVIFCCLMVVTYVPSISLTLRDLVYK